MKNLEERIRDAMTSEDTVASPRLLEIAAARRAAGVRVALPVDRGARWRMLTVVGTAAAAALLIVVPLAQRDEPAPPAASKGAKAGTGEGNLFLPAALMAQTSTSPSFTPLRVVGSGLREGTWTHGEVHDGKATSTYTYKLRHSEYQGARAWLILSTFREGVAGWSRLDSLWAEPDSMSPLFRVSNTDNIRTERTYRASDILVGTTVNGFTSWRSEGLVDPIGISGGPLYTVLRMPEIAIRLQSMPLSETWKGSLPFQGLGKDMKVHTFWLNFAVDGTETITVPGGTFECWRIALFLGARPEAPSDPDYHRPMIKYWVSRDKQWLIRIGFNNPPMTVPYIDLLSGEEE